MNAVPTLTILNRYKLTGSADEFVSAISALARRVEAQGHGGILSYRFFVNADSGEAKAVIDYADPEAWIGHHDIAMEWPEMKALHAAATLTDVIFLGPLTPEIEAWIAGSTLKATIISGFAAAAGFSRSS